MTQQPNERLLPCPIDAGKAEWREHPYRGTGASGMEAPDLSIRCTVCGLETARERTEQWERGKGTYSIREEAEAKLLARWNTRVPAVQDEGMVEAVARAMQEADLHDGDEGNHYRLFDLLGFSGENKSVMITRQLAKAAIQAMSLYGETTSSESSS